MSENLTGAAAVLELADRARRVGGIAPTRLYHECVEAFRRDEIGFDEVTPLFRHAMAHAGMVVPRDRSRFFHCPTCGAGLDVPPADDIA